MTLFLLTVINDVPTRRSLMESSLMIDWWLPDRRQVGEKMRQIHDCLSYAVLHVTPPDGRVAWRTHRPAFESINPMDCFDESDSQ